MDDSVHKLIHKRCHKIRCPSDIEYHMTLNTIFSVVVCVCNMSETYDNMSKKL